MAKSKLGLTKSAVEVLSYIINENPVLKAEIDLPVQGDPNALGKIGELIINNNRFKNAFLNTVNVIALTVIRDNTWRNPWDEFTEKGVFRYGESVRELFVDIRDIMTIHDNDKTIVLCHYPMIEWDGYFRGTYHFYGHVHNNHDNQANKIMSNIDNAYNIGVDILGFMPRTADEIIKK